MVQLVSLTLILWMVQVIYPVDSAIGSLTLILWIVIYLVDGAIGFPNTYPLDIDLSS